MSQKNSCQKCVIWVFLAQISLDETFGMTFWDSFLSFIKFVYFGPFSFYFLFSDFMQILFCDSFLSNLQDEHLFMGVADSELFNLLIVWNELFKYFCSFNSPIFFDVLVTMEGVLDLLSTTTLASFWYLGEDRPLLFFSEVRICRILLFSSRSSLFILSSSSLKLFIQIILLIIKHKDYKKPNKI